MIYECVIKIAYYVVHSKIFLKRIRRNCRNPAELWTRFLGVFRKFKPIFLWGEEGFESGKIFTTWKDGPQFRKITQFTTLGIGN